MSNLLVQEVQKKFINKKMPVLRPGYQIRVHQKIKEGEKERIQVFEGLVVSVSSGHGPGKTFTVRKVVQGIGVEKVLPINSPLISKIEIRKTQKVRQAKLNFMRDPDTAIRLKGKLGMLEKDEDHKKKKGLMEEEKPEVKEETAETSSAESESTPIATEEKAEEPKAEEAEAPKEEKKEE